MNFSEKKNLKKVDLNHFESKSDVNLIQFRQCGDGGGGGLGDAMKQMRDR